MAAGVFDEIDAVAVENEEGERVPPAQGVRLIVRDSAGSPERAAAAVAELAAIDDVVAILGPLLAAEAEAAASAAETAGVPLLTLTSREDVAAEREGVFRLRTTPDDEVSFLVDHAVDELGAERFAVLYPADTYGRGCGIAFGRRSRRGAATWSRHLATHRTPPTLRSRSGA